jgi:hypothetical protein
MLARGAARGDFVDPGQLCRAAIAVMDNPPADPILVSIADHLVQAVMDYAYFDAPVSRLQIVLAGYLMAADAIKADEILQRLRQFWVSACRSACRAEKPRIPPGGRCWNVKNAPAWVQNLTGMGWPLQKGSLRDRPRYTFDPNALRAPSEAG